MKLAMLTTALLALTPAVARAQQPVDPLGAQQRLTLQGADGDATVRAQVADIAYSTQRNQFLVVWENRMGADAEIFGRLLAADGTPIAPAFQISGLGGAPDSAGRTPAVAYDFERDRYVVAFTRDSAGSGREVFIQLVRASDGALINSEDGTVEPSPRLMSQSATDLTFDNEIDVVYRPDANNDASPGDAYIVAYGADEAVAGDFDVMIAGFNAATGSFSGFGFDHIVNEVALEDAIDPALAAVSGTDEIAVTWEGSAGGSDMEIYARRAGQVAGSLAATGPQRKVTNTGDAAHDAFNPAITAGPGGQFLVAYQGNRSDAEGTEVHIQLLEGGLSEIGPDDLQVSSAGPPGSTFSFIALTPSVAFNGALSRYLVTWLGNDVGRPGLSNDEREVMGTVVTPAGTEAEPQDFTISRMGADNDDSASPSDAVVATNDQTGRWLSAWSSDDPRPPLADNEFELWGRQVGENFDRDGDGAVVPADCDDANPAIRPGAADVFDNGIDEDCAGGDAQNPDRDGDGSPRPADCDDANPLIRPGIPEIPNNRIDENCDGKKRRTVVNVNVERFFAVFSDFTRVTRLRVTKLRRGMRIQLRCSGKGCPKPLRKGKVRKVKVKKAGAKDFTKLFKRAKLKPGAVIEVRVLQTGAIGRVDRFVIRDGKVPKRVLRCLPPGAKKPRACS
jgi:hypothetical protein